MKGSSLKVTSRRIYVAFWRINVIFSFVLTPLLFAFAIGNFTGMETYFFLESLFYMSLFLLFVAISTIMVGSRVRRACNNTYKALVSATPANQPITEAETKPAKITIIDYILGVLFALLYWSSMFVMSFYIVNAFLD